VGHHVLDELQRIVIATTLHSTVVPTFEGVPAGYRLAVLADIRTRSEVKKKLSRRHFIIWTVHRFSQLAKAS
jgi:hypothetical protein